MYSIYALVFGIFMFIYIYISLMQNTFSVKKDGHARKVESYLEVNA